MNRCCHNSLTHICCTRGRWVKEKCTSEMLIHCGQLIPYGNIDLCKYWFRWWLVSWLHQAISWTNVDLTSNVFSGIHLSAILEDIPMNLVHNMHSEITLLILLPLLPGAYKLIQVHKFCWRTCCSDRYIYSYWQHGMPYTDTKQWSPLI